MTTNSSPISPLVARSLQLVGVVMIVSFMLDAVTLLYPPNLVNVQWRLGYTSQIVDRGVIPLVGIAFVLAGIWVNSSSESSGSLQNLLKTGSVVVASVLGVMFLLIAPLHAVDTIRNRDQVLSNIEQQASRAENRLENQLNNPQFQANLEQRQEQFVNQIQELIANEQRLDELLASGEVSEQQADLLTQFKENPGAIEEFAEQQAGRLPNNALGEIRQRKLRAERQIGQTAVRSLSRALSSGLLAVAYIGIGLTGLTGGIGGAGRLRKRRR